MGTFDRSCQHRVHASPSARLRRKALWCLAIGTGAWLLSVPAGAVGRSAPARAPDPGIEVSIDLTTVSLRAVDARSGERFDGVPVTVGSPGTPTPRGRFRTGRVVLQPSWTPSDRAREFGARSIEASLATPMGVAKIPFANNGSVAVHGGGHDWTLGKPVSGGCVRVHDSDLLRLLAWMEKRGALGVSTPTKRGERERSFVRPVRVTVR